MAKKSRPAGQGKKIIASALVAVAIATGGWWVVGKNKVQVSSYAAAKVLDGDTFVTQEGLMIRLASLNAPEEGRCGSEEATEKLTELVMNKPLYFRITIIDSYKRLVSLVYTPEGSVNEELLRNGLVRIEKRNGPDEERLEEAGRYAIDHSLGIYSDKCLSKKPDQSGCDIKGNIHHGDGENIYTLPGCQSYPNTIIQKDLGDRWFCIEAEAIKAGFRRSGNCHTNIK